MPTIQQIRDEIDAKGQTVQIVRDPNGDSPTTITVKAKVMGYSPEQMVGAIEQGDTKVVISALALQLAGYPGAPLQGDRVVIGARETNVQFCNPAYRGEEVAIYRLNVRGG